ncbi:MAG TPA: Rho termination factor N-terminal domain-containing protein, partial [Bacteroidia bacterium]|nr:Rho termination factor N-terminal domain-containing protein [Bacteroidia bacterium]
MYDIISLNEKLLPELKEIAKKLSLSGVDGLKKQDLIYKILDHQALSPEVLPEKKPKAEAQEVAPKPEKAEKAEKVEKQASKVAEVVAEKP